MKFPLRASAGILSVHGTSRSTWARISSLRLIRGEKGQRDFMGPLKGYDDASVTMEVDGEDRTFAKKDAAFIRLYEEIDLTKNID